MQSLHATAQHLSLYFHEIKANLTIELLLAIGRCRRAPLHRTLCAALLRVCEGNASTFLLLFCSELNIFFLLKTSVYYAQGKFSLILLLLQLFFSCFSFID